MTRAAYVSAGIGGAVAVVEGLLLIALGSLAGLADNPEGEPAMTDGFVVLAIGGLVLATVFAARQRVLLLASATAAGGVIGFVVENPLWIFAAVFLFVAAALALISNWGHRRPLTG